MTNSALFMNEIHLSYQKRIRKVVYKPVDCQQMAFIRGRQIMNVVLIVNEAIDSRLAKKNQATYANWTLRKPTIMSIEGSFLIYSGNRV